MRVVLDASVMVKWIVPDPEVEPEVDEALALLKAIREGHVTLFQPPHWLAEVAAVVTRLRPETALEAIDLLDTLELPIFTDVVIFKRASQIAHELKHHLFDTLYHAVALELGLTLISADEQYCRKARHLGQIVRLGAWREI